MKICELTETDQARHFRHLNIRPFGMLEGNTVPPSLSRLRFLNRATLTLWAGSFFAEELSRAL